MVDCLGPVGGFVMKVKICGLTREEDIDRAVELGANALGFIVYPKSPRYVSNTRLAELLKRVPPFVQTVAVAVDLDVPTVIEMERILRVDVLQLHGSVAPETLADLRPRRLIRSYGLPHSTALAEADVIDVDGIHLDKASPQHGGTGETFDWNLAVEFKQKVAKPIILAGGLNPGNVEKAIQLVRPYAVDVSSGVESSPGRKDHTRLKDFIQICQQM